MVKGDSVYAEGVGVGFHDGTEGGQVRIRTASGSVHKVPRDSVRPATRDENSQLMAAVRGGTGHAEAHYATDEPVADHAAADRLVAAHDAGSLGSALAGLSNEEANNAYEALADRFNRSGGLSASEEATLTRLAMDLFGPAD